MPTPYISYKGLATVQELILGKNVEACGHLLEQKSNELTVYISVYGKQIAGRGTCQHLKYTKYIFHTHPSGLIAYPSAEDVVNILKTGAPFTSVIFTNWGIWEISSAEKMPLDRNWRNYLHTVISQAANGLYHVTDKGLVMNNKREGFIVDYIRNVLSIVNGNEHLHLTLGMSFTPWRAIKRGRGYYLRFYN